MIDPILVVGAGQMGGGIAQVAATAGLHVTLVDVDEPSLERGLTAVRRSLDRLREKGKVADPGRCSRASRPRPSSRPDAIAD